MSPYGQVKIVGKISSDMSLDSQKQRPPTKFDQTMDQFSPWDEWYIKNLKKIQIIIHLNESS